MNRIGPKGIEGSETRRWLQVPAKLVSHKHGLKTWTRKRVQGSGKADPRKGTRV